MIFNNSEIKIKFKTFDPFVLKNLAPLSAQKNILRGLKVLRLLVAMDLSREILILYQLQLFEGVQQ